MFDHHLEGRRQGKGPKRFLVKTCTHLISILQTINSFVMFLKLQTSIKGNEILSYMTLSVQNEMGFDSDLIIIIIHYTWFNFNVRGLNILLSVLF